MRHNHATFEILESSSFSLGIAFPGFPYGPMTLRDFCALVHIGRAGRVRFGLIVALLFHLALPFTTSFLS